MKVQKLTLKYESIQREQQGLKQPFISSVTKLIK